MNDEDATMKPSVSKGDVVTGTVTRVEDDAVHVDFGYGTEGRIARSEWSAAPVKSLPAAVLPGDAVKAVIRDPGDPPALSRKAAVDGDTWRELRARMESETPFDVRILAAIKGGLVADVEGVRGFLPASLVDLKFIGDLTPFQGRTVTVVITEMDETDSKLILSRKRVLERDQVVEREAILSHLSPGQKVEGVIARLTPFGAFVDLGGVDGLLHVSEMSWARVDKPEDAVRVGQRVTVSILRLDPEAGRISLSMKEAQESPWKHVLEHFHIGETVTGTVRRLTNFGAFVEVAPGVEGLVHVSQISDRRVATPADALSIGQTVQAKILDIKPDEERMSLSVREAMRGEERRRKGDGGEKQPPGEPQPGATLGDLFGDLLRDRFK